MLISNMNRRDIQRAVQAKHLDRTAGDAPSIGPVTRIPGTGRRKNIRRKKRHGAGNGHKHKRNERRRVIAAWSVVGVVGTIGVLGIAMWLWLLFGIDREGAVVSEQAASSAGRERVRSRFKSPSEPVALAWVKQALQIRDPAKVEDLFHLGLATPGVVVGFLRDMEAVDGVITGYDWRGSMDANNLLIDGVIVNTRGGAKPRNRLALLTPDEKGRWKIDFDAFARTVKPAWGDIMAMESGQGLVRVMVARDTYYNGPFRDETEWICYGMASPDFKVILFGYCRMNSPQAAAMKRMGFKGNPHGGGGNMKRATLEIQRAAGAESRQFEITRVLAEDWVMSATPFDQHVN